MQKPQLLLTLDTALNGCSAGLFTSAGTQGHWEDVAMTRGQAEALWPMIERVRERADIAYRSIDGVAVTCGPGNFTGLRIGLAVARTFARMRNLPAYAVSTTHCIAFAYAQEHDGPDHDMPDRDMCVALDTKRGDYYTQMFSPRCEALEAPVIRDTTAICNLMRDETNTALIGHGLDSLVAGAPDSLTGQLGQASHDRRPNPATMAYMCFEGHLEAETVDDLYPLYMREAETNMAGQSK